MPPAENGETVKYNLPPPVSESGREINGDQKEQSVASPEQAKNIRSPKMSKPKAQPHDFQITDFTATTTSDAVNTTATSSNPAVADDNDLIEKEWVAKAKKIIEENREDPFNQSKEITLFKADYMKKRYNKVLRVSE